MGNKFSKTCGDTFRSCKNVTCFDNCECLKCFKKKPKANGAFGSRSFTTLNTISMPYIDEAGKLLSRNLLKKTVK